jgi:hypothetical protein
MNALDRLTLLSEPVSDAALLTGGDWLPAMPLSNMQVAEEYEVIARSASAAPAATRFNVDLLGVENIRGVVLLGNFTTAATLKLTQFGDAGFAVPVQSFTTQPLYPVAPWGSIPFGAKFWFNGVRPWPNPERTPHFQIVFPNDIGARWWRFEIEDPLNPAGYLDIGRLFMAPAYIPEHNYEPDNNQFGLRDNSIRSNTLNGGQQVGRRTNPRYFSFSVKNLPETEVFGPAWRLMDMAGFDREIFVIPQPSDVDHLQQRSFFARIAQAPPLVQAQCLRGHIAFELTEII